MKTQTEVYRAPEDETARIESALFKVGRRTSWLVKLWFAEDGTPNSPQRVREIYARNVRREWRRTIVSCVIGLSVAAVVVPALLLSVDRYGFPATIAWPCAGVVGFMAAASIIGRLYSTWASSLPIDHERDVFVWPLEVGLPLLNVGYLVSFLTLIVLEAPHPGLLALTVAVTAIGGGGMLWDHVKLLLDPPAPARVAPCRIGADERVAAAAAGIVWDGRFGDRVHDMGTRSRGPWSGRRLNRAAQNALLVTGARLYFIYVPLPLGNQGGEATRTAVFTFATKLVRAKLDDMLRRTSLAQIYASSPLNFALDRSDIKRIRASEPGFGFSQSVDLLDRDGHELTVTFRHRDDFERVASALRDGT